MYGKRPPIGKTQPILLIVYTKYTACGYPGSDTDSQFAVEMELFEEILSATQQSVLPVPGYTSDLGPGEGYIAPKSTPAILPVQNLTVKLDGNTSAPPSLIAPTVGRTVASASSLVIQSAPTGSYGGEEITNNLTTMSIPNGKLPSVALQSACGLAPSYETLATGWGGPVPLGGAFTEPQYPFGWTQNELSRIVEDNGENWSDYGTCN